MPRESQIRSLLIDNHFSTFTVRGNGHAIVACFEILRPSPQNSIVHIDASAHKFILRFLLLFFFFVSSLRHLNGIFQIDLLCFCGIFVVKNVNPDVAYALLSCGIRLYRNIHFACRIVLRRQPLFIFITDFMVIPCKSLGRHFNTLRVAFSWKGQFGWTDAGINLLIPNLKGNVGVFCIRRMIHGHNVQVIHFPISQQILNILASDDHGVTLFQHPSNLFPLCAFGNHIRLKVRV